MTICSQVLTDGSDEMPWQVPFAGGELSVFSRRSPEKQTANEDSLAIVTLGETNGVIAIADGCGGMAQGGLASRKAIDALLNGLKAATDAGEGPRAAILDSIEQANRDVCDLGTGAATTFICVEIDRSFVRPYHVGDSQMLVVSSRGRVKFETGAHSPVGYGVQGGFLSPEEAIHHEDRHLVSNVLGSPDTRIEIGPRRRLAPWDTLVLASDGLFDNLRFPEICDIVRRGPLQKVTRELARQALARMAATDPDHPSKPDDLTFLVYRQRSPTR
ncbi:MAG: serine/threonine-protein phosphatase [Planctomycetota bacterium]|nr:serine/threonine-protein phosphatase [Planctomycetota bacterium]